MISRKVYFFATIGILNLLDAIRMAADRLQPLEKRIVEN